jgi:hypothetical protein
MRVICLLQQLLGAKVRGAEYHDAHDPETEIWRACQRSGFAGLLGDVGARPGVYCRQDSQNSDERCFAVPRAVMGVKCCQANTLRWRRR